MFCLCLCIFERSVATRRKNEGDLSKVETEDVIVHPIVVGAGRIGNQMEALREFHRVSVVVDHEVTAHRHKDAIGLHGHRRLAIARHNLMLHALEGKLLLGETEGHEEKGLSDVRVWSALENGRWERDAL